jgi:hypothetical protein
MPSDSKVKSDFLAVYDYGTGGVWMYIRARSKEEIVKKYPFLLVPPKPPHTMSESILEKIKERDTYDIDDDPPSGTLLAMLNAGIR